MTQTGGDVSDQGYHQARRFIRQRSVKPLITYSRKDRKPLPLTANQFRASVYDTPHDVEHDTPKIQQAHALSSLQADEDGDLELSDAQLVARRGSNLRPGAEQLQIDIQPPLDVVSLSLEANHRSRVQTRPAPTGESSVKTSRRPVRKAKIDAVRTISNTAFPRTQSAQRRIAVNELLLVRSLPVSGADSQRPPSSPQPIDLQDPIVDHTSSPDERGVSLTTSERRKDPRKSTSAPLSAIRTRLKAPPPRFKAVKRSRTFQHSGRNARGRDGFQDLELKITPVIRRKRQRQSSLTPTFGALQLRNGRLPDVVFGSPAETLKFDIPGSCESKEDPSVATNLIDGFLDLSYPAIPDHRFTQGVNQSRRTRSQVIEAQLSSVSAPLRKRTCSNDGDNEVTEDCDEQEHEDEIRTEYDDETTDAGCEEDDSEYADQVGSQGGRDEGVMLDFRYQSRPRSFVQRPLIEAKEAIEISEPSPPQQRLVDTTKVMTGDNLALRTQARPVSSLQPPCRPRSILKNSTFKVADSTTGCSQTAANTRRNSGVHLAESHYFADVSGTFPKLDAARHTFVPRHRSSHLEQEVWEAEMLDIDTAAFDPSANPAIYTTMSGLDYLQRRTEIVRTARGQPKEYGGLEALTRSLSRTNSTLSQPFGRSSMPFKSPTKIR